MKGRQFVAILFIGLFSSNAAYALSTEVTVLILRTPGTNPTIVNQNIQRLQQVWPNPSGIGLNIATGASVYWPQVILEANNLETTLNNTMSAFGGTLNNYRLQHGADIILLFIGGPSEGEQKCGVAPQKNWIGSTPLPPGATRFQGTGNPPLDLRGRNSYYMAIMRSTNQCFWDTQDQSELPTLAAHELGHLFGAGHTRYPATDGRYLDSNSHAFAIVDQLPPELGGGFFGIKSIMAEKSPPGPCQGFQCMTIGVYSSYSDTNNLNALQTTALSVANYFDGPPAVSCNATFPPFGVQGSLGGVCAPTPWTQHFISWQHQCPSQVSVFWVWKRQPLGALPVPAWPVPITSTPAYVAGTDAEALIQSCSSSGNCSGLSSSTYVAQSLCPW